eukprot:TRINITY_DN12510_c0_g1_i1.p1 TRINITY_DN12510_c0_g1~~TRINITY_DN12510_c0_g1_i1.p1  ORF type:complete len:167 (+),score=38.98 TRINITY_DN12510_c0_g1_i1:396-896(+)
MEVEPEMLVLGVLSEAQSKSKGGLSKKAIGGVLVKRFESCLPKAAVKRTSEWLEPILEGLIGRGMVRNDNAGMQNTVGNYVIVKEAARGTIAGAKDELRTSLNKANTPRARKIPLAKKNKKKESGLTSSMDKIKGLGKTERLKQAASSRATAKREAMRKLRRSNTD